MPDVRHGTLTGYTYGCRCEECRGANREYGREYRRLNPDRSNRAARAWFDATNAETKAEATSHRQPWTRSEVDEALRNDISVRELARQLGRSYSSVLHVRNKAARRPDWLEGLSNG